jgi:hypothetical protein
LELIELNYKAAGIAIDMAVILPSCCHTSFRGSIFAEARFRSLTLSLFPDTATDIRTIVKVQLCCGRRLDVRETADRVLECARSVYHNKCPVYYTLISALLAQSNDIHEARKRERERHLRVQQKSLGASRHLHHSPQKARPTRHLGHSRYRRLVLPPSPRPLSLLPRLHHQKRRRTHLRYTFLLSVQLSDAQDLLCGPCRPYYLIVQWLKCGVQLIWFQCETIGPHTQTSLIKPGYDNSEVGVPESISCFWHKQQQ